jgi:hypothetical protein
MIEMEEAKSLSWVRISNASLNKATNEIEIGCSSISSLPELISLRQRISLDFDF